MIISIQGLTNLEIDEGSISIEDAINERSTASFVIYDKEATLHITQSLSVTITHNNKKLFSGYIDSVKEKTLPGTKSSSDIFKNQMYHVVSCKDNHYLADKRLIAKSYRNMYAGDIVKSIIQTHLAAEGVIIDNNIIKQGEFLEEVVFNYIYINKALEKLAESSDYIWYIDYDKKMHFKSKTLEKNAIDLIESDILNGSLEMEVNNQSYRNKQYIKGGKDITEIQIERFKGDGANRNFTLAYPIAEKPQILINGISVSPIVIGIRGIDENCHWYWSKDSNIINQDEDRPLLLAGTDVYVQYKGLIDVVVISYDIEEIDRKKILESNSGIVEDIAEELDNNSLTISLASSLNKLKKFARNSKKINFRTRRDDLISGQTINVKILKHDINEDMLIRSVDITFEDGIVWYNVTCITGPEQLTFYKMFELTFNNFNRVIRENINEKESLIVAQQFFTMWLDDEMPNIYEITKPSTTLYPSATLYPSFAPNDMIKYMEVLSGATVLLRVPFIKQNQEHEITLATMFYIKNAEANANITSLKFYGGYAANETVGSGVLVDTQTLNYSKTLLEIIQIIRIDERGW